MTDRCGSAAHDCDQCRRDWLYTAKRSSSDLGAAEGRCRRIFARRDTIRKAGWRVGLGHWTKPLALPCSNWKRGLTANGGDLRVTLDFGGDAVPDLCGPEEARWLRHIEWSIPG